MATSLSIDETAGVQNDGSGESENNELAFAPGVLPTEFTTALGVVATGQPQIALSGYTTTTTSGANFVTFGANVVDVGFTDSTGAALNGVYSGLRTTDGTSVYLYTYSGDNNVLLARKGNGGGTADPADDTANANGAVVFAAYLDTGTAAAGDAGATGARVWLAQYAPLLHPDATDPDDTISPANVIYVTASTLATFSLEGAPSGQNLFLMFGDGSPAAGEKAIVVTGRNPDGGDTVNTGQGGGGTTIGSNNQMLDPGEGLYFSFVTLAGTTHTVPNLNQTDADVEANIDFAAYHPSDGARFSVVQLQPPKGATLKLTAIHNENNVGPSEVGVNYTEGLVLDGEHDVVPITQVTVSIPVKQGKTIVIEDHVFTGSGTGSGSASGLTVTFNGGVVTLTGVETGYGIAYTAAGHNRVLIENPGNDDAKLNAAFDIGGFSLSDSTATPSLFPAMNFDDDGPTATGNAVASDVDEDGLATGNKDSALGDLAVGNGDGDNNEATNAGNVSGIFGGGADGLAASAFSLVGDATALAGLPSLTSKGGTVSYQVTGGNTLQAFVNVGGDANYNAGTDRPVFLMTLTSAATGAFTFTLQDQLDHPTLNGATGDNTENDLVLNLGTVLQATDGDGDTVRAAADRLAVTVDDDTPLVLNPSSLTIHNTAGATGSAALGAFGRVGGDEPPGAVFTGTNGSQLQGTVQDGTPSLENLTVNGSNIYLFGFGTSTLTATTNQADPTDNTSWVFRMTLNPDGSVAANDLYNLQIIQKIANTVDVPFGSFTAQVASGNPLTLVVNNIGGSSVDALFSGFEDNGATPGTQTTVNVSQAGVGVGTGQDFDRSGDLMDRIRIEFLQDDGDGTLESGEAFGVNRFTFVMNQNNSPADDGDLLVRIYDGSTELQITGILVNGQTLVGAGGTSRTSNDGTTITAAANGLGYDLHGLGGGTAGSSTDNDTVTIIAGSTYTRIDITGTGNDANKDTFDILLQSIAIPASYDIDITAQAQMTDFDADLSAAATLNITFDADGVFGV